MRVTVVSHCLDLTDKTPHVKAQQAPMNSAGLCTFVLLLYMLYLIKDIKTYLYNNCTKLLIKQI